MKTKLIPFKASEKALTNLKQYMTDNNMKSRSGAVNDILEKWGTKTPSDPSGEGIATSELPTERLIECPIRTVAFCVDCLRHRLRVKAPVDTSVCRSCQKYPCESWKWIESEDRVKTWKVTGWKRKGLKQRDS